MVRDGRKREARDERTQCRGCRGGQPAARCGEKTDYLFRRHAGGAEGGDARVTVALGEATAVRTDHERNMEILRLRQAKGAMEDDLGRGRGEKVVAAHDLCDAHRGIIDHDSEGVAGAITARDREIPGIGGDILREGTGETIGEGDYGRGNVWQAEAPGWLAAARSGKGIGV